MASDQVELVPQLKWMQSLKNPGYGNKFQKACKS
jgi:hypothetical protein